MKKSVFNTTARVLVCLTVIAAMASSLTSCKDEEKDSADARLNFVNKMMQSSEALTCTWEGWHRCQRKSLGSWHDESQQYAVIRFNRSSPWETSGDGVLLYFKDSDKTNFYEGSRFYWGFDGNQIKLKHMTHSEWYPMYAEYNTSELKINAGSFYGHWWEKDDYRWEFEYKKSNFSDWTKYPL